MVEPVPLGGKTRFRDRSLWPWGESQGESLERLPELVAGMAGQRHSWAEVRRDLVRERAEHLRGHTNRVSDASHRCRATVERSTSRGSAARFG